MNEFNGDRSNKRSKFFSKEIESIGYLFSTKPKCPLHHMYSIIPLSNWFEKYTMVGTIPSSKIKFTRVLFIYTFGIVSRPKILLPEHVT